MQVIKSEVCVLGAGPGGATAALSLAKEGIPSLLIDKASFPRDKICGDALSGKVVEVLKKINPDFITELASSSIQVDSWGVTFVAPNLQYLRLPFISERKKESLPPGFISKRMDFDNFLVEKVKQEKLISFLPSTHITSYFKENENWILRNGDNSIEIHCSLLIVADGANSYFARHHANIPVERNHYCAGLRAYYKGVQGMDHENFIELHFLKDFLPGYFWIFPLPNGEANVGVGMRSDVVAEKKMNLKEEMIRIIEQYPQLKERFKNAEMVDKIRGYNLPLGSKKRKLSGDGYLLLGDAASLIDPFTGEGIGNAMLSAMAATKILITTNDEKKYDAKTLLQYDQEVYRRLWPELKVSYRMQQLVNFPWLFNLVVKKANKSKLLRDTISGMFEDIELRSRLKNPMFYIRLLFTNG